MYSHLHIKVKTCRILGGSGGIFTVTFTFLDLSE